MATSSKCVRNVLDLGTHIKPDPRFEDNRGKLIASELTSWRARVSVHAIRKCSIYEDLCRFQCNGTVEGLHHIMQTL